MTLHSADRESSGYLRARPHGRHIPRVDGGELGYASDDEGHTAFAYEPKEHGERNAVVLLSGTGARPFTDERVIAHVPEVVQPGFFGGGDERLLVVWAGVRGRIYAALGSVFGAFGSFSYVGTADGDLEGAEYQAFVDSRGRAVILFAGNSPGRRGAQQVFAAVAPPHRPFGPPFAITPSFRHCGLERSPSGESPGNLVTSPDGHALILVSCEHGPGYLVRYAP